MKKSAPFPYWWFHSKSERVTAWQSILLTNVSCLLCALLCSHLNNNCQWFQLIAFWQQINTKRSTRREGRAFVCSFSERTEKERRGKKVVDVVPGMWAHHVNRRRTGNTFTTPLFSVKQDIDSQHYTSVRKTINASPQIFHTSVGSVQKLLWQLGY